MYGSVPTKVMGTLLKKKRNFLDGSARYVFLQNHYHTTVTVLILRLQEVVAGMMDLPPHLWRKPRFQHQSENRERQRAFLQNWSKYDWTAALEGGEFEQ